MTERFSFKVVFLGNKNIGKHSLLARLTGTPVDLRDQVQVGMPQEEKRKRVVTNGNKEYEFWFHETAGQEEFRGSVTSSYFRHAQAIIYAYDETDGQSFSDIQNVWMLEASRCGAEDLLFFLIGNKNDLVESGTPRAVSEAQAQEVANNFMTNPMHVSAQTGAGCEEAFNYISQHLIQHAKGSKIVSPVMQDEDETPKKTTSTKPAKKKDGKCMC